MSAFQLIHFLQENSFYFLIPFHHFRFLAHFFNFLFLTAATQFILNGFDLLLQEIFALLLIDVFTCTHLDRLFDFSKLHFAV